MVGDCVRYFTLKLIFVQEKNVFHCAQTESVPLLADHFASLEKNSLALHRGSRCT